MLFFPLERVLNILPYNNPNMPSIYSLLTVFHKELPTYCNSSEPDPMRVMSPPRVQREQLAAIFQLLKDNKATFGDVSEGDMEEQLRLYSI